MEPKVLTLTGPSCSGKTTLANNIFDSLDKRITKAVSYTTRDKRAGEVDGFDYHFISEEVFLDMLRLGKFIEWINFPKGSDNYYGYTKEELHDALDAGKCPMYVIEPDGLLELLAYLHRENIPSQVMSVTADFDKLSDRFIDRLLVDLKKTSDKRRVVKNFYRRYKRLDKEMTWIPTLKKQGIQFDYEFVNNEMDDLATAYRQIRASVGL